MSAPLDVGSAPIEVGPVTADAVADGRYRVTFAGAGVRIDVDRLRRERQQLVGELVVRCALVPHRAIDGVLAQSDFNFSSASGRASFRKYLADRSGLPDLDWGGILEALCIHVLKAEREGQPLVALRDLAQPIAAAEVRVLGLPLFLRHPVCLFGDGGSLKSFLGLAVAGQLARDHGARVAYIDWELDPSDHRDRLERLFGGDMPAVLYHKAKRPLVYEADTLRRRLADEGVDFAILDSIVFACAGPAKDDDTASEYFRATRDLGVGTLHIGHVTKGAAGDDANEYKPFGSNFFHNGFRATTFVKATTDPGSPVVTLGLYPRKCNLGRLGEPFALAATFFDDRVAIEPTGITDRDELAAKLTIKQRIVHLLRGGPMTVAAIAEELGEKVNSVEQTCTRGKDKYLALIQQPGSPRKFALLERKSA